MMALPQVYFKEVQKQFGTGPVILDNINLEVQAGEFISLIGPSGCGKSTLLRLISGLTPNTAGEIVIDGMTPENARAEMAYIFQEANLLPWLRVQKNVELALKVQGHIDKYRRKDIADKMIDLVGLDHARNRFPHQLSGGMRMRVSIARALSLSPRILLLDEPFGALDEMTRDRLNEEILEIRAKENWTAFFVTHSVAEAVFLSSRIVVLSANPGRVAEIIEVPFSYPRTAELRETTEFLDLVRRTSMSLRSVMH
ncbi:ABC transporter ATP-binding protein [Pelagicoccus albus]|uniref:ABC transporter ATP-binding protein n=2 Tax=Pelagicoccus albus TaxID=415222 RepID=A0A7X1B9B3_9BACT|nr:ABC transporter ATP-binding protein [Pelagicoccus albus]